MSVSYSGLREGMQRKKRRLVFVTWLIISDRLVCQHNMWISKHFKAHKQHRNAANSLSLWRSLDFNFFLCPCFYFHSVSAFKFTYKIPVVRTNKSVQLALGSLSSVSKNIELHFHGACNIQHPMDLSSCPIPGTVERIHLMVVMLLLFLWDVEDESLHHSLVARWHALQVLTGNANSLSHCSFSVLH